MSPRQYAGVGGKAEWKEALLAAHLQVCSISCRANPTEDVGGTSPAKSALSNAQY